MPLAVPAGQGGESAFEGVVGEEQFGEKGACVAVDGGYGDVFGSWVGDRWCL
jgi:hypothetical protein